MARHLIAVQGLRSLMANFMAAHCVVMARCGVGPNAARETRQVVSSKSIIGQRTCLAMTVGVVAVLPRQSRHERLVIVEHLDPA